MSIKLKCNAKGCNKTTESLWLRHWKGRDYLVCYKHLDVDTKNRIKQQKEKSHDFRDKEC